ncbi:MAG: hypothetical protein BGP21_07480 [Thiobacillus sp. 65-29]|jgi:predicted peroxiredoxin|nr:MAG: hypothetical protein BGP21_07480 [Thiobacillus sp. 65-29]
MNARDMNAQGIDHAIAPAALPVAFPTSLLTIMLMSGREDGGKRATLAFVAAVSAAAMERPVQVFMAGDGAIWGDPEQAQDVRMAGFPSLAELVREYLELGGELLICSTCEHFCTPAGSRTPGHRWPSLKVRGMAALLESQDGGSSLSF